MQRTVLAGLALLWMSACTTVIIPPRDLIEPTSVFVLDHGRHSSLVLPANGDAAVRYSYGDWDYYVLRQTDLRSGLRALLQATPSALGQQMLAGPLEADAIRRQLRVEVVASYEVKVEAAAARRLREELGELFDRAARAAYYSEDFDVYFVPHPEPYTLTNNSNHMVKRWLEKLGSEVSGNPVLSNWHVRRRRHGWASRRACTPDVKGVARPR